MKMQPEKRIVITRRWSDWHACIEGESGKWGCGRTPEGAVAELRRIWPEAQQIEVVTVAKGRP